MADETALSQSPVMSAVAIRSTGFSLKRVIMHATCLIRRPEKAAFFLAGIRRELSLLLQEAA
jgi:hypothetical protein